MEEDARRKAELAAARAALAARIPTDQFFELPGRPTVVFQVRLWNLHSETLSIFQQLIVTRTARPKPAAASATSCA